MSGGSIREGAASAGRWTATVLGTTGVVLWASETALARFTAGLPTFEIVGLAFGAAAMLSPVVWCLTGDSPLLAFRQPARVWLLYVPSLVCYHACIYYALQHAPAAPAALLQGCTPVFIVLGSALLPGTRIRWWHLAGVTAGLEGLIGLSFEGGSLTASSSHATWFLVVIGFAAGLWGVYSLVSSRLGTVPTSVLGVFYAASAVVALGCSATFETWIVPSPTQAAAATALGLLPMGLALLCWDFGLKRGDVLALGVVSYVEPLIGAALVVSLGQGELRWSMLASGLVIVGGAVLGSADFLDEAVAAPEASVSSGANLSPRRRARGALASESRSLTRRGAPFSSAVPPPLAHGNRPSGCRS